MGNWNLLRTKCLVYGRMILPFFVFAFCFFTFLHSTWSQDESKEVGNEVVSDATNLRQLLSQIIEGSGKKKDQDKVKALKAAMASHPEIFTWVAQGKDLNQILKTAELPELPANITRQVQTLKGMGQAINDGFDKVLKKNGMTNDPATLKKITVPVLIKWISKINPSYPTSELTGLAKGALVSVFLSQSHKHLRKKMEKMGEEDRLEILNQVPNSAFLSMAEKINAEIAKAKFSESSAVKMIKDPNSGLDMSAAPKKFVQLFDSVISGYYDQLPVEDKRNLALGLLALPVGSNDAKKLSSILNNSGPVLQKLFQLLGNDVKSPLLAEVMKELKSNIKPFDSSLAKGIVADSYGKKVKDVFSHFPDKPLAAASVGQVYLAKLQGSDREVIVKILRPGIKEKARREIETLKKLAPDTGSRKIIDRMEEALFEELDFRLEGKNMEDGLVYERPDIGLSPIKLVSELPPTENVLVMEKAAGKNIDKDIGDEYLHTKGQAISDFLNHWFDEAMFGGGFFHADLHAGNLFFKPLSEDEKYSGDYDPDLETDYLLTPIDFGSVGTLAPLEQKALLRLALGTIFESPQTVVKAFATFHKMKGDEEKIFTEFVTKALKDPNLQPFEAMNLILSKSIEMEFDIPKNFLQFNRGRMFLEKQISEFNKKLDEYDPEETLSRFSPETIYRNVAIKRLSADVVKKILGLQDDEDAYLDDETIAALVDDYFAPKAKKYAKKAAVCAAVGAYNVSYSLLDQMTQVIRFMDPLSDLNHPIYNQYQPYQQNYRY